VAEEPVLATREVHTGDLLDPAQAVVETRAVQPQLRGGPLDVAGVVEVGLQRERELLVLEQGADADGQVAECRLRQRGQQPDVTLLESELQDAIRSAIEQLPETQRMALILRRYEELSYEEIASVLDQSVPAVKSLLFRARTELRQRLKTYLAS